VLIVFVYHIVFTAAAFEFIFTVCAIHRFKCTGYDKNVLQSSTENGLAGKMVFFVDALFSYSNLFANKIGVLKKMKWK
jgi:hypothetical protein